MRRDDDDGGGSATFRGVGQFTRPGATRWAGALLCESDSQELADSDGIAVLFEYEVGASGKTEGHLYEWK